MRPADHDLGQEAGPGPRPSAASPPDAAAAPGVAWRLGPAWIPLAVLSAAMVLVWRADLRTPLGSPGQLLVLNLTFATAVSAAVAHLAARTFLADGAPGLLMLGAGALAWSLGNLAAATMPTPNAAVTVHNACAWLSASFHLLGAVVSRRSRTRSSSPEAWLVAVYSAAVAGVALVSTAARAEWLPVFFVQGEGGTALRQAVVGSAAAMFAASAAALGLRPAPRALRFRYWYSHALALISAGLLGLLFQPSFGSPLGWVARLAQYLGGAYMVLAAVAALRETRAWRLPLEEALQRSERWYGALFEGSLDAILATSPGGRIRAANPAACALFGMEERALLAMERDALFAGGAPAPRRDGVRREALFVRRDGTRFQGEVSSLAVDAAGHGFDIIRDVSQRRRDERALRDAEERARLALEAGAMATWDWDVPSGAVLWNEEHHRMLGYRVGEVAPSYQAWAERMAPASRAAVEATLRRSLETGGDYSAEFQVRLPDGATRWLEARGRVELAPGGAPQRCYGVMIDVTARRQAEEAVREADRRKTEFISVLSHELRNPLAAIGASVQVQARARPGSPAAARAAEVIQRQTEHLTRLVDDLLDLTRVAHGKIDLRREPLDAAEVARQIAEDLRPTFVRRQLALRVEAAPAWTVGDRTRLTQIVGNLLQNAAKFTPPGGAVDLSVRPADGEVEIRVRDTGAGIPAELLPRLFEPFVQGDPGPARAEGGLGLGLALVKGLAALHGGTVRAASEGPGRGAELVVRLPQAAGIAPPDRPAACAPAARPRTILLVEDNADAAGALAALLELQGHRVWRAGDGASGIALARAVKPEFVLSDLGLPDLDGCEVARALRADPALADTCLIAVSGYAQPDDLARARQAGFDHHLAKPPPLDRLAELLARAAAPTA